MKNGKQFTADLSAWAKKAGAKLDALARQTSQEVAGRVVQATPVDTGFLRGSWQPSLNAPKGAQGAAVVPNVGLVVAGMQAGDTFWMTNNARYARFVEYGTTKMRGRFYTTDTVSQWKSIVQKVASELSKK